MDAQVKLVIKSKDEQRHTISGWAYVSKAASGEVVDHSGQSIDIHELEKGMQRFMKEGAFSGEMHRGDAPNPVLECYTFTPEKIAALGLPSDFPQGTVVTIEVGPEAYAKVKEGSYMMLSIEGQAMEREA